LPDTLPFVATLDPATGTIRQKGNPEVRQALSAAYSRGSLITGTMDADGGLGESYADAFAGFICETLCRERFDGLRVLEVGCGTGFLLSRLKALGATVLGIEPGGQGKGGTEYGVEIVDDYFPCARTREKKYDLILAYGVLEHIEDPHAFLLELRGALATDGSLILAVPDCAPYIEQGDISCFFHEHWSYYDSRSLSRSLNAAGLTPLNEVSGRFGHNLYVRTVPCDRPSLRYPYSVPWKDSLAPMREKSQALQEAVTRVCEGTTPVGIYVPSRFANYVTSLDLKGPFVFVDDNPVLHNTYLPGIPTPIEPFAALLREQPAQTLIMSWAFSGPIGARLTENSLNFTTLRSLTLQKEQLR
jgi:SAM-dependent methyltransferase